MSLQNSFPHDYKDIGYTVFPIPNKTIRVDDPNYIHYVPDRTIADRNNPLRDEKEASGEAYVAPAGDENVILRTYVSEESFRRSRVESQMRSSLSPRAVSAAAAAEGDRDGHGTSPALFGETNRAETDNNDIQNHLAKSSALVADSIPAETQTTSTTSFHHQSVISSNLVNNEISAQGAEKHHEKYVYHHEETAHQQTNQYSAAESINRVSSTITVSLKIPDHAKDGEAKSADHAAHGQKNVEEASTSEFSAMRVTEKPADVLQDGP